LTTKSGQYHRREPTIPISMQFSKIVTQPAMQPTNSRTT
jgi:hypothetical protein